MTRLGTGILLVSMMLSTGVYALETEPADVTIVSSRANQLELEKLEVDYRKGIRFWSRICKEAGLTSRIAGDFEMETKPGESQVFVFHLSERLTKAQRGHIEELQEKGVSIILVGMVGQFDDNGVKSKSLAAKWFDLQDVRAYTPKESAYLVPLAGNVFSSGTAPGFRYEYEWAGRYFLASSPYAAAANVDWTLGPFPKGTAHNENALLAIRRLGRSRMAWFGISPDTIVEMGEQHEMITRSVGNLLRWAARKPVVTRCHWAGCSTSAAVVTADVEDRFETGEAIALACHKAKVKGSFFLVGSIAPEYPEVVTALAQTGQIGTHSVNHGSFKDRPYEEQFAELMDGKKTLLDMGVPRVTGFRPPMEEYDENTIRAVADVGLDFIHGNLSYDRAYPIVRDMDGASVYQFARIVADDYNLVVERGVKNSADYRREYIKEFGRMHALGGLFPFSFHTNYLALKESVDVVRAIIEMLKKEDVWITTFGDIVSWLEARSLIQVETSQVEQTVTIKVTNNGPLEVKEFALHYFPPADLHELKFVATPAQGLTARPANGQGFVVLVDLKPGETKEINVR